MHSRIVRLLGALLALSCMAFILGRFVQAGTWQQIVGSPYAGRLLGLSLLAAPVYLIGLVAAGVAWWSGQSAFMSVRPALRPLFSVYAVTQFAKYLPGNVGHYVGRHVLLRRYDVPHTALVMGTLTEAGFMVLAALVWAASNLQVLLPAAVPSVASWQMLLAEILGLGALIIVLRACCRRSSRLSLLIPLKSSWRLLPVLPLHLVLFAMMAASLMVPAQALPVPGSVMLLLPGAAAASWVAGFLVVGAPAGIGVREAIFIALLHGQMAESDILLLAAGFRIATFSGDMLFLLLGVLLGGAVSPDDARVS
jgi:hypothetical protein